MKILADESVDFPIIKKLRESGYYVLSILESYSGLDDELVLQIAFNENYLLLTADKDFGTLSFRFQKKHHGIVLYRLFDLKNIEKCNAILNVINQHQKKLIDNFTVITSTSLRIRKL